MCGFADAGGVAGFTRHIHAIARYARVVTRKVAGSGKLYMWMKKNDGIYSYRQRDRGMYV